MAASSTTDLLQEGLALHRRGAIAEAQARYAEVLRADPGNADAHYYLGMMSCQQGRFAEGAELARKALAGDPRHARAHILLGRALAALGRYEQALTSFETAIAYTPDAAEAHGNRGDVLSDLGRNDEAIDSYDRALIAAPDNVENWFNRGLALSAVGRHREAASSFDRAIAGRPGNAEAHLCRAKALAALRRYDEAGESIAAALAIAPNFAEAHLGRGNILIELAQYAEALAAFDRALALKSDLAEACVGHGNVLIKLAQHREALAAYDKALAANAGLAAAWLGRGNVLVGLKQYADALTAYDKALALQPRLNYAASLRLYAKLQSCDWTNLNAEVAQLLAALRAEVVAAPFAILSIPSSAADQLQCTRANVQPDFPPLWRGEVYSHDRIRVAYISGDFQEHPVAQLTVGLFEHHDKSRFQVAAISFGSDRHSSMRERIKNAAEQFVDVEHNSNEEIAKLVRELETDIAVDLMGFTMNSRVDVFARRPAPVQVNYLGYPGTMGSSYVDYILADSTMVPEDQLACYAEQVVWLPDSYQVNDPRRAIAAATPTRRQCGLSERGFVFCAFNNSYKILPDMFDVWMGLLRQVGGSVLWLKDNSPVATSNLRREAERRGVPPDRLVFAPYVPLPADHLARYRQADLFLDTLPYNAHTTASDALWAGLPVLTCLGATFAGRVAGSVLKSIGLDELVTHSLEEYEALALRLAREPSYLAAVKDKLARNRTSFPLFDTARATRQIEAAYTAMWERYQRGEVAKPRPQMQPLRIG